MARPWRVEHRLDGTTRLTVLLRPDGEVNIVMETIRWQEMTPQQREEIVDQLVANQRARIRSR